ncbi:MAG: glycoside hydrolase family 88 protein [Bacteroidales bacterium]|nr:glycoside hydrolase family 88 protein [Bacteroidales bacterium]
MVYLFCFFIVVDLVIFGVDLWVRFTVWYRRIHIGKWISFKEWSNAVDYRTERWLKHSYTVRKTDNNRFIILDVVLGNHKSEVIQYWQDAGLVLGVRDDNPILSAFIERKIDVRTGDWKEKPVRLDIALLGYALMEKNIDIRRIKSAMDSIYSLILEYKGDSETFPYVKHLPDVRFVDTLGLVCPFLAKYSVLFNCEGALKLAYNQIMEYDDALLAGWGFPSHAYNIKENKPLGIYDWGRGIGWYILALIALFDCTNDVLFRKKLILLADKLLLCQKNDGGFSSQVFSKNLPTEGSITVIAGLLLGKCYSFTGDVKYKKAFDKLINSLMTITQRNGALDMCQGDTKTIGIYSVHYGYMPFAQGLLSKLLKENAQ